MSEILLHSLKTINPIETVLNVNSESTTPELIVNPSFEVNKPKDKKTIGDTINNATSQNENLFSLFPHVVLIELAKTAIATVFATDNQIGKFFIFKEYNSGKNKQT